MQLNIRHHDICLSLAAVVHLDCLLSHSMFLSPHNMVYVIYTTSCKEASFLVYLKSQSQGTVYVHKLYWFLNPRAIANLHELLLLVPSWKMGSAISPQSRLQLRIIIVVKEEANFVH